MPQHQVGHIRIFLLRHLPKLLYISDHEPIPVLLRKIPIIRFGIDGPAVPQMIMPGHVVPVIAHIGCEFIIPLYIFHHAVTDLQDPSDFAFGLPLHRMYLCLPVFGKIIKFIPHLIVLPSSHILCAPPAAYTPDG